jgi:hypothetical protein
MVPVRVGFDTAFDGVRGYIGEMRQVQGDFRFRHPRS